MQNNIDARIAQFLAENTTLSQQAIAKLDNQDKYILILKKIQNQRKQNTEFKDEIIAMLFEDMFEIKYMPNYQVQETESLQVLNTVLKQLSTQYIASITNLALIDEQHGIETIKYLVGVINAAPQSTTNESLKQINASLLSQGYIDVESQAIMSLDFEKIEELKIINNALTKYEKDIAQFKQKYLIALTKYFNEDDDMTVLDCNTFFSNLFNIYYHDVSTLIKMTLQFASQIVQQKEEQIVQQKEEQPSWSQYHKDREEGSSKKQGCCNIF